MNQILSTENTQKKESKKVNKSSYNSSNSHPDLVRKAAMVFSIILIAFALVIITVKVVQIIKSKAGTGNIGALNKPQVSAERMDDDTIKINISYDEKITRVSWWWNDNKSEIKEKNGDTKAFSEKIPAGEINTITIEVTATDGKKNTITETFVREFAIEIEWEQVAGTDNLNVIAKSEKGIAKIVYYWNDEPSITVPATSESQKELTTTIQLKRGINTLHTIVTDNEGNTEEKEEMFNCVKDPEIDVQANLDQMLLVVVVTHDMGFEKIEFEVNGEVLIYDKEHPKYNAEEGKITFKAALKPGIDNQVRVEAYSNEVGKDDEKTNAKYTGHNDLRNMSTEEE